MEGSEEEMHFLSSDGGGDAQSNEVSLENDAARPSNTEELRGMLQQAGTDLTVRYLTGQISFDTFTKELEKTKPQTRQAAPASASPTREANTSAATPYEPGNLPNFDLMMDQNYSGDEEESDEVSEDDVNEEYLREFQDSLEPSDKDEEWVPKPKAKKVTKGKFLPDKGKKKGKAPQSSYEKPRKKRKERRKVYALPKLMAGTNGKAMLLRAQGKLEEAVELFYEVIKHAPKAAAPYEALGSIHEEKGNLKQAIKFYMLAANLRGRFANEWLDIVDMCRKINDDKLVMTCFSKGLSAATTREDKLRILTKKASYFIENGNQLKALQTREHMLLYMDSSNPASVLAIARDVVHDYLEMKEENGAISTLQYMMKDYPNDIFSEDIHTLVELYMGQKNYIKGLQTIIKHCGVTANFSTTNEEDLLITLTDFSNKQVTLISLEFPSEMPIDLRSKLLQCLVFLKVIPDLDILKELTESIVSMDANDYGDVHMDVAEAMALSDYHKDARPILETLVSSDSYSEAAAVWLLLAQCLNALGDINASVSAYTRVVKLAPAHHAARVTLASLLQQMGKNEVALEVLSTEEESGREVKHQQLLLHKCQLLHSQGKKEQFIEAGQRLITLNLPLPFNTDMVRTLMHMKTVKSRKQAIQGRHSYGPDPENVFESNIAQGMSQGDKIKFVHKFADIFFKLCDTLRERGRLKEIVSTAARALTCPVVQFHEDTTKDIEFLLLKCGPVNADIYHLARNIVQEDCSSVQGWNLYNYILTRMKGTSVDLRFSTRCLMKNPDNIPLSMLNSNERLISGTYTQALAEYMSVFKVQPHNDLAVFCAALCLLHIASNNHIWRKNILTTQISCLLSVYRDLRGDCQETFYNIGRAWSQLNIQFAAVHYYKKALQCPPAVKDDQGTFDLRREIAYNLSRIYLRSGNIDCARHYIETYCVI